MKTLKRQVAKKCSKYIENLLAQKDNIPTPVQFYADAQDISECIARTIDIISKMDESKPDFGLDQTQLEAINAWSKGEPTPVSYKGIFRSKNK